MTLQADDAVAVIMTYFDEFPEDKRDCPSEYTSLCRGKSMEASPNSPPNGGLGSFEVRLMPPQGLTSNCKQRPALRRLHRLWSRECYGTPLDAAVNQDDATFLAAYWLHVFGKNATFKVC